jgi:hypothetical protein
MMATLDKFSLIAMAAGVAMMLQPWWSGGFQVGFFVTLAATVMQIVTSHLPPTAQRT